jgi:hypothetical protein
MLKYLVEVYDKNANLKPFVYKSGDSDTSVATFVATMMILVGQR